MNATSNAQLPTLNAQSGRVRHRVVRRGAVASLVPLLHPDKVSGAVMADVADVAVMLGVMPSTVRTWKAAGIVTPANLGKGGPVRFHLPSVREEIAKRRGR